MQCSQCNLISRTKIVFKVQFTLQTNKNKKMKGVVYILIQFLMLSSAVSILTKTSFKWNNWTKTRFLDNSLRRYKTNLDKIKVEGNFFVDDHGRKVLFHGLNAVQKGPPWYPEWLLNETNIITYKTYGFNVLRLGTMWAGVMPLEKDINTTYINTLKNIVTTLKKHSIYVILDMHQDVLSSLFQTYDGAPKWLVEKLPRSKRPFPWPLKKLSSWSDGYLTDAVGKAFQGIYDNYAASLSCLVQFWEIIADNFKTFENVLGYELMNEPWAGDIYSYPSLLLPGVAGKKNLQQMYNVLGNKIRQQDENTLIFYEPVTWGIFSNRSNIGTGFSQVPGGPNFKNRSVLSYHFYCWLLQAQDAHITYPFFKREICHALAQTAFQTIQKDIKKLGGGSFLTEFGLCGPDGNNKSTTTVECNFVMSTADKYLQSWTYWGFTNVQIFNFTWQEMAPFSRVYVTALAGDPLKMYFNITTKIFTLTYIPNVQSKSVQTEIFVPKRHYNKGFLLVKPKVVHCYFNRITSILFVDTYNVTISKVKLLLKPN